MCEEQIDDYDEGDDRKFYYMGLRAYDESVRDVDSPRVDDAPRGNGEFFLLRSSLKPKTRC